jgi:RNA polymerase sigma-70 factor (ECF subfamily)
VLLVEGLQHGKAGALAELVHKYQRRIYRIAMQITRNHEDASDVTQETFLKVYESIYSLRRKAAFETWVYRIAVNKATNLVKHRNRRSHRRLKETIHNDDFGV